MKGDKTKVTAYFQICNIYNSQFIIFQFISYSSNGNKGICGRLKQIAFYTFATIQIELNMEISPLDSFLL